MPFGFDQLIVKIAHIITAIVVELSPAVVANGGETLKSVGFWIEISCSLDGSFSADIEIQPTYVVVFEVHLDVLMTAWTDLKVHVMVILDFGSAGKLVGERNHLVNLRIHGIFCADDDPIAHNR
jgi:hypothetical protein